VKIADDRQPEFICNHTSFLLYALDHVLCTKFFVLSEFENFLLCERILINVTTCQNETLTYDLEPLRGSSSCIQLVRV
jgi:hypothetical protein